MLTSILQPKRRLISNGHYVLRELPIMCSGPTVTAQPATQLQHDSTHWQLRWRA